MKSTVVKFIGIIIISMIGLSVFAQSGSANDKLSKKERKAQEHVLDSIAFEHAYQALQDSMFVLEAHTVYSKRGSAVMVNDNLNFISLEGDEASVQLAFTGAIGYNGVGGITIEGKASNIQIREDKKGNVYYSMTVRSPGVSVDVFLTMSRGSNYARADVNTIMHSSRVSYSGVLVPLGESTFFKGTSRF